MAGSHTADLGSKVPFPPEHIGLHLPKPGGVKQPMTHDHFRNMDHRLGGQVDT